MGLRALAAYDDVPANSMARRRLGGLVLDVLRVARSVWGERLPVSPTILEICLSPGDYAALGDPETLERALARLATIRAHAMCMVTVADIEVRLRPVPGVRPGLPEILATFRPEEMGVVERLSGVPDTEAIALAIDEGPFTEGAPGSADTHSVASPLRPVRS